jgi:hypothetical protein
MPIARHPDRVGDAELAIAGGVTAEQHPVGAPAGPVVLEGKPRPVAHQKGLRLAAADL